MKKSLIIICSFFALCGFNYADLGSSVSKELKANLKQQLEQTKKDNAQLNAKLFAAAREGDITVIKQLVNQGADVNARTEHKQTPLMFASFFGHDKACQTLIDLGADTNAKDVQNDTALTLAKNAKVVEVLVANKADINAQDNFGRTPLMYALENDNLDAAFALSLYQPNLNLVDNRGSSTLMYMAANKNYSIEAPEHHESQAILKAYQIEETFDKIMRRQDCTLQNELGQTALDIANLNHNTQIAQKIANICK